MCGEVLMQEVGGKEGRGGGGRRHAEPLLRRALSVEGYTALFRLGGLLPISDHVMILLRILPFKFSNNYVRMNK